jgi:hypothetical protein
MNQTPNQEINLKHKEQNLVKKRTLTSLHFISPNHQTNQTLNQKATKNNQFK